MGRGARSGGIALGEVRSPRTRRQQHQSHDAEGQRSLGVGRENHRQVGRQLGRGVPPANARGFQSGVLSRKFRTGRPANDPSRTSGGGTVARTGDVTPKVVQVTASPHPKCETASDRVAARPNGHASSIWPRVLFFRCWSPGRPSTETFQQTHRRRTSVQRRWTLVAAVLLGGGLAGVSLENSSHKACTAGLGPFGSLSGNLAHNCTLHNSIFLVAFVVTIVGLALMVAAVLLKP